MFRRLFRHFIDREVGVLGDALDALSDRLSDQQLTLAALQDRFDMLQNRVGMRLARSERQVKGVLPPEVAKALREHPEAQRAPSSSDYPPER